MFFAGLTSLTIGKLSVLSMSEIFKIVALEYL